MRATLTSVKIRSDRVYRFPLPRPALWQALGALDEYPRRWPWLRRFDAAALAPGEEWHCTVQPPLPYALSCSLRIASVVEPELIEADITGDLSGSARVELRDDGDTRASGATDLTGSTTAAGVTEVHLVTELAAASAAIRMVSRTFPSIARWGHDWVLDTAARQLSAALAPDRR